MGIRRMASLPSITSEDLQFTFRGRKFGVELTDFDGLGFVMLLELRDGAWKDCGADMLESFTDESIAASGGAVGWIKTVFIPWLQGQLNKLFPPQVDALPTDPQDQVDALLSARVTVVSQPNGSLRVVFIE